MKKLKNGHIEPGPEFGKHMEEIGYQQPKPSPSNRNIPSDVKQYVWERDGGRCAECGSNDKLEYDHIIPVSKGGSNTKENVRIRCMNCNRTNHAKRM